MVTRASDTEPLEKKVPKRGPPCRKHWSTNTQFFTAESESLTPSDSVAQCGKKERTLGDLFGAAAELTVSVAASYGKQHKQHERSKVAEEWYGLGGMLRRCYDGVMMML